MSKSLKRQLEKLREKAKVNPTKEIRDQAMDIYRKRAELITKEDLLLFEIIIKKT